jgi:hypothetical protein
VLERLDRDRQLVDARYGVRRVRGGSEAPRTQQIPGVTRDAHPHLNLGRVADRDQPGRRRDDLYRDGEGQDVGPVGVLLVLDDDPERGGQTEREKGTTEIDPQA